MLIHLIITKEREFKRDDVVHLKVTSVIGFLADKTSRGEQILTITADDITPLPGAEPPGYCCRMCGIIEEAQPDGSLPDGWAEKKYERGSCFVCNNEHCRAKPMCRVCGCIDEEACETPSGPCSWVEPDLCSACANR